MTLSLAGTIQTAKLWVITAHRSAAVYLIRDVLVVLNESSDHFHTSSESFHLFFHIAAHPSAGEADGVPHVYRLPHLSS